MAGTRLVHTATVVDGDSGAFVGMSGADGKEYLTGMLTVAQAAALAGAASGKILTVTLDGSNRPLTVTKGANVFTIGRPDSTHLTITLPNPGGLPDSVVTAVTTATGELLSLSGNFP